jgi:hypothetical protein
VLRLFFTASRTGQGGVAVQKLELLFHSRRHAVDLIYYFIYLIYLFYIFYFILFDVFYMVTPLSVTNIASVNCDLLDAHSVFFDAHQHLCAVRSVKSKTLSTLLSSKALCSWI